MEVNDGDVKMDDVTDDVTADTCAKNDASANVAIDDVTANTGARNDVNPATDVNPVPNDMDTSNTRTERLIITHIENVNFKSYAGKQVLGPFHKSFSSIVGPNGSGKSNVIDSMLFVFGFRSKKIRSKKVSLLIHNSEGRENIESCSVTVFFQKIIDLPGEEFEVVPNSEFYVKRTAHINGSTDYYMDGKKQTFKEIGAVLRACGIDLDHNRFLILQGEVEQISQMKPKAENEHEDGMLNTWRISLDPIVSRSLSRWLRKKSMC